jgi:hypothetical protein
LPGGQSRQNSRDLWKPLDQTALETLRAGKGVLTIDRTDRSKRNLLLSLERMVGTGTLRRIKVAGSFATYRLREASEEGAKGVPDSEKV